MKLKEQNSLSGFWVILATRSLQWLTDSILKLPGHCKCVRFAAHGHQEPVAARNAVSKWERWGSQGHGCCTAREQCWCQAAKEQWGNSGQGEMSHMISSPGPDTDGVLTIRWAVKQIHTILLLCVCAWVCVIFTSSNMTVITVKM